MRTSIFHRPAALAAAIAAATILLAGCGGSHPNTASAPGGYIGNVISEAVDAAYGAGPDPPASVGVHIHWGNGNLIPTTIICFNIYRDQFVQNTGLAGQTPAPGAVLNDPVGPVLTEGNGVYDAVDTTVARQFTYSYANWSTSGSSNGGSSLGTLGTEARNVSGVRTGVPHIYYVTAVYQILDPQTGAVEGIREQPLDSNQAEGYATPIEPVDISSPSSATINGLTLAEGATKVTLDNVVFGFVSQPGADDYVVNISPDTTFTHKLTLTQAQSHTINGGEQVTTDYADLAARFPGVSQFAFRIGARNSTDVPGPSKNPSYTGDLPNPDLNPVGGSYVYSVDGSFNGS